MSNVHFILHAGIVLAAVAGIAVALLIWGCIWFCILRKRRQSRAVDEKGQLPGKPMDTDTVSNFSTAAMLAHLSNVHTSDFATKRSSLDASKNSTPSINADTSASPEGTVFVTSRNMTGMSEAAQWPLPEARVIPAPLWQDVEILPENIYIAKMSDGTDWVLGQGSYGTVRGFMHRLIQYERMCAQCGTFKIKMGKHGIAYWQLGQQTCYLRSLITA